MASSSTSSPNWKHDVFPSFHGADFKKIFLRDILKEFRSKRIEPFIDDEINWGKPIGPELTEAIRSSRIAIVMLSRSYTSSSPCLDELVEIIKCRKELGQLVGPIFYDLDPFDVKNQTGDFGKTFRETCKGKTKEQTGSWKHALEEVAEIVGYHTSNWDDEVAMIKIIATHISCILNISTASSVFAKEAYMKPVVSLDSVVNIAGGSDVSTPSNDFKGLIAMEGHSGKVVPKSYPYFNQEITNFYSFEPSSDIYGLVWEAYIKKMDSEKANIVEETTNDIPSEVHNLFGMGAKIKKLKLVFKSFSFRGKSKEQESVLPASRISMDGDSSCGEDKNIDTSVKADDFITRFRSQLKKQRIDSLIRYKEMTSKENLKDYYKPSTSAAQVDNTTPLYTSQIEKLKHVDVLPRLRSNVDGDSVCGEDKSIVESEVDVKADDFITKFGTQPKKQRIDSIIKRKDVLSQEHRKDYYKPSISAAQIQYTTPLCTSQRDFEGTSNRVLHAVYIYCTDTIQHSFASHLSMDFQRKGIAAFVNYNESLDVIEGASAFVVVFSENYLYSTSFLDKLEEVLQCKRKTGQVVVPVFYGISPDDVAMWELSGLTGHYSREECTECELVEDIVKDVYEKHFPTEQIGINSRLLEIEQLICKQPWDIRRIGIWGMPGIGKTTLAKAVFDKISGRYEASCFIKHFERDFHEKGFHRLLEEHFGETLKELPRVCSSITRPSLTGQILSKKRTLVVLDDVHSRLAAKSFLEGFHWFGPGSLIIITSRDKNVFRQCQINHLYEVESLNKDESLQLFSQYAFGTDIKKQNLLKLSMEVIDYANGNPSALGFYGRELKGKRLSEMETIFLKLKLRTPYKIHNLFKSSYDTLSKREKDIFLDIACFFNGENVDYVVQLLEGCGFSPHVGIDVLVEKCLVTISENRVKMHRIIQDFGREIINGETVQIERRRRLWEAWTIRFLLEDDKIEENGYPKGTSKRALGTEDIEGIFLDISNLLFDVKPNAFENMLNLRLLKIYSTSHTESYGLRLPKGLDSLPYELRLLHWENYPLQSLPQDFDPCHLVELNMPYSQLHKLWDGPKDLEMLKIVRLCHSQQLTEIDHIFTVPNVELIDLQGCTKLQSFPAMCHLQHLRVINLSGCKKIKSLPEVSPNMEELHLQGTGIRELPESIVSLYKQAKFNRALSNFLTGFSGGSDALNDERLSSLAKVTSSNQHLGKLFLLNMKDCSHLENLPRLNDLESLEVLDLSGCSNLKSIEGFSRNLKELYLVGTAIKELPPLPSSIELLNAHSCVSLVSFSSGFERLPKYYTFSNCFSLSEQVVSEFLKNALSNVDHITREYQQQKELKKSLAFSFIVPSPTSKEFTFDLQPGSSVMIQLGSSWKNTLGVAILLEVSFLEDYQETNGFGISYVCRWKDKKFVSHRLEKDLYCSTPGEGVRKNHMFILCDLIMHPSTCKDLSILADLVVFEFFTVNKQNKLVHETCTVKKCGVHVITDDTSFDMTQPFPSSEYQQEISVYEVEEIKGLIYIDLDENDMILFLYIACLFNDEKADFMEPLITSTGLETSSKLKKLAKKSLLHISPYGIVVQHDLLQKMGREIIHRQPVEYGNSIALDIEFGTVSMASSSSYVPRNWKYDVFTSLSEEDDCNNKISHLLAELECKPVKDKMMRSQSFCQELVEAIRDSRGLIVVLSKNYASSSRCLNELVEIMNCKEDLAPKVVPIFYDVVPSDVEKQTGDFGIAFEKTCIGKSVDKKQKWARALAEVANIAGVDSCDWDNEANLPHSFKMHSVMCLELKKIVDRIMRILPEIEDDIPGCSSGIRNLCLLQNTLEKVKLLFQYCSKSSKLYMAVTGDTILLRGSRAKKSLEQSLTGIIQSMVPTVLAIKIIPIIQDLKSTVLTLESTEEEAIKAIKELMQRGTSSSLSLDDFRDFHAVALKLQLSTPEAIVIERRSLESLLATLGEFEASKRHILNYLLKFLKRHDRDFFRDHK